jgi:hypothetical protein
LSRKVAFLSVVVAADAFAIAPESSNENFLSRALGGHLSDRSQGLLLHLRSLGGVCRVAQASLQIRDPRLKLLDAAALTANRLE